MYNNANRLARFLNERGVSCMRSTVIMYKGQLRLRSAEYETWTSSGIDLISVLAIATALILMIVSNMMTVTAKADNFTDVFYTNSFRGSFEWIQKMDWLGTIVQAVISIFSLVGVSLIVIRIMTSMLYLSARGLWEEVHDLKQTGESELYDFGLVNMAKSWAKGKAGTGLDAIFGAILILLPDVKKYSDFGEKSGQHFEEDTTIAQYILKIALPTVLSVFFLAMAFNGTLVKAMAVTVDAMGTIADRAVSQNYSSMLNSLIDSYSGYQFSFSVDGSEFGSFKNEVAKGIYSRCISQVQDASTAQLNEIGKNVEAKVNEKLGSSIGEFYSCANIGSNTQISTQVKQIFAAASTGSTQTVDENDTSITYDENGNEIETSTTTTASDSTSDAAITADRAIGYLGFDIVMNTSSETPSGAAFSIPVSELILYRDSSTATTTTDEMSELGEEGYLEDSTETASTSTSTSTNTGLLGDSNMNLHIYITQEKSYAGTYFNFDTVQRN